MCKKPSSISLINRLAYTNLLGVDSNLKNGRWDIVTIFYRFVYVLVSGKILLSWSFTWMIKVFIFFILFIVVWRMATSIGKCCSSSQSFLVKFCCAEYVIITSILDKLCLQLNYSSLYFEYGDQQFLYSQVGDFYEAIGFDACILVEYAGLNPFGGLRSDSIPKAGCPIIVSYFLLFPTLLVFLLFFKLYHMLFYFLFNLFCRI